MMRLSVGYPNIMAELKILENTRLGHPIDAISPVTDAQTIVSMQQSVKEIFVHEKVRDYIVRLVQRTRDSTHLTLGGSPRASMMLFRAAQAFAAVQGRSYVIPDDIKVLVTPVLQHRLILNPESRLRRVTADSVLAEILKEVAVPAGVASWKQG